MLSRRVGREDHRVLRHDAERAAQRVEAERRDRHAVDRDRARLRFVEAHQQLEHRRLAGAGRSDERDRLARRDVEREVGQRGRGGPRRIVEADRLEAHAGAAAPRRQRHRRRGRPDELMRVEQFHQAVGRAGRAQHVAPHFGQPADRAGGDDGVQHERREQPRRHRARHHRVRAEPQHEHDRAEHEHDDDRRQPGTRRGCAASRSRTSPRRCAGSVRPRPAPA